MQQVGVPTVRAAVPALVAVLLAGCGAQPAEVAPGTSGTPAAALAGLAVGARVDYQLGGPHPPAAAVAGVVRDRTAAPAAGLWSACYVNAFQTQPGSTDWPADLLLRGADGEPVEDPDWPGEFLVDIGTAGQRDRALAVVGPWLDGCAAAGFSAVEPDNLDSWTRSDGLLEADDAAAMARALVDRAHGAGLAIGQKNAPELTAAGLGFDYAVAEDCGAYDECAVYTAAYGTVLDVEYTDDGFDAACGTPGTSVQRRDLDVTLPGDPAYVVEWCPDS
ncbi:endo alpha-1,4 polygalactosaminidase [Modestobacter sp. SSW1-42]|uniref:endo alpha-1,4 polygalactosaminidase n=1 Tax=Modestobacter sp. SSW1-42 TaxID=596372 RepID=UPI003986C0D4